jgi:hypothetical protein
MESEKQLLSPREGTFRHFKVEFNEVGDLLPGMISFKGMGMSLRTNLCLFPREIEGIDEELHNFGIELGTSPPRNDINRPIEGQALME